MSEWARTGERLNLLLLLAVCSLPSASWFSSEGINYAKTLCGPIHPSACDCSVTDSIFVLPLSYLSLSNHEYQLLGGLESSETASYIRGVYVPDDHLQG